MSVTVPAGVTRPVAAGARGAGEGEEIMGKLELPFEVTACIEALSEVNDGRRVVLYLDPTMQFGENFLPTLNVEGDDGFYRFPDAARPHAAAFFGDNYETAKERVDEVNVQLGFTPEQARDVVISIMAKNRAW